MQAQLATPADFGLAHEDVVIESLDGVHLHAWYVGASGSAEASILVLHGNAENISTHMRSVLWLAKQGYNLLLLDYRGYGRSGGKPSLPGLALDVRAGLNYLLKREAASTGLPVFVLGQSLGASVAISSLADDAKVKRVAGVIAHSPVASYRSLAREKLASFWLTWPLQYPLSLVITDSPRPDIDAARMPARPLLIIGGVDDRVVPAHHAEAVYAAAAPPKSLWRTHGLGHIQAFNLPAIRARFLNWLEGVKSAKISGEQIVDLARPSD